VREFGDALGFLLLRLAELTHTPSSKWSPYMNAHQYDELTPAEREALERRDGE
jgi:hypothetical protein